MKRDEIRAGALLSYLNLLIGNLIPFIYTPIMLRMLGQAEYGIYGIAQSVMGYIGLLNFGIGGSIIRYLAKYRAEGDLDGEQRVFGLFIKIYSVIGAAILLVGTFCSFHLGFYGRSLMPDELLLLERLVRLMTLNTSIFMPFNVFSSMILAHERFIFSKTASLITSVVLPCLNLVLLFMGFGSIGLVLSATVLNFVTYAIYTVYVIRRMHIRPCFQHVGGGLLGEIIRFSLFVFLANIVDILFWSTDKLIIGWAVGAVATAVYNIGATFNTYITSLSTAISGVLMPKVTKMAVKNTPPSEFTALFIKVGRLQFLLISFVVSAFVAFGRQFVALWAGAGYEDAYYVALLVMIPVTVPLIQNTGLNILYAMNKHQFRSVVYLCIAVLNVGLTFWWVEAYGIIGAAMATCIAYVVGNILIINWYYYKKIGIDIPLFWKNILHMCPVMLVMGTMGWFILDALHISNWLIFFALAAAYTLIYWVLAYFFMMNDYERAFIKGPVSKIFTHMKEKEMETNHRINSIDIARLFAAILVIASHTQAIMWFSDRANGNIQILTRVAVPFFFCTSGYFLQKGYVRKGCSAIATSIWKVFRLYVALSIVYFTVIFLQNPALLQRVEKWMLIDFLFNGSYYHLWYMVGVIYSMVVIYLICKFKLTKALLPLAVFCYAVGLLGTSYYGIGSRLPIMSTLFDSGWFLSVRRIFLMGFPFTALGWTISEVKLKLRISKKHLLFATTLVALLFVAEIVTVTVTGMSRTIEITVFLYPLLFLLFQICLAYPLERKSDLASACRDTANFTYFWHPLVSLALRRVVNANFFLFTITTAICLLLGFGYHSLKNRRRLTYERRSKN